MLETLGRPILCKQEIRRYGSKEVAKGKLGETEKFLVSLRVGPLPLNHLRGS